MRHEWYAQADEEAEDGAARRVDQQQQLLTVPEGLAGRYAPVYLLYLLY